MTLVFRCAAAVGTAVRYAAQPDPVLDAMQAELKRSMTLTLNQLDKPYYLAITWTIEHTWSASATLGGVISLDDERVPHPSLRIRVGDYKFDNTNWTGANAAGSALRSAQFPDRGRQSARDAPVSLACHRFRF